MRMKLFVFGGIAVAGTLVAVAIVKKVVLLGLLGLVIYASAIRRLRRPQ